MAKKPTMNSPLIHRAEVVLPQEILDNLDFTATQKQVDTLMQTVLHDTSLNENKVQFIKEQLADGRYEVHPKIIASKLLEYTNIPLPELEPEV